MITNRRSASRWPGFGLAIGVALADQIVKRRIAAEFPLGESLALTPFFNLVHVLNEGAAFSLLASAGGWQRYIFIALALVISIGLVVLLTQAALTRRETWAYSLLLGGALGNLIDRILYGPVVDYLDFHALGWHWPAFNFADTAIVLSVVLLLSATVQSKKQGKGDARNSVTTQE